MFTRNKEKEKKGQEQRDKRKLAVKGCKEIRGKECEMELRGKIRNCTSNGSIILPF